MTPVMKLKNNAKNKMGTNQLLLGQNNLMYSKVSSCKLSDSLVEAPSKRGRVACNTSRQEVLGHISVGKMIV